jgi:gliding motility-associated-like protein
VLTAKASDNTGATTISSPRNVSVNSSSTPPTVAITNPTEGQTFPANSNITISAAATAVSGSLTKVEFFNGANKLGEDLTSPYSFNWNGVPTGNYTLTAKATTNGGATNFSSAVNIIVSTASEPPVVNITSPSTGAVFDAGATVPITATASDPNGNVVRVEFFNGITKLGEDLSSPYSFSWQNAPQGSFLIVAMATDNSGATGSAQVQIFIDEPNHAPQADAGEDRTVQTPVSNLTILGSGTDSDGVVSFYEWSQVSGPEATISQNSFGELVFNTFVQGVYVFELTVTDNGNKTGKDQLTITVTASLLELESIPRYFSPNNDGENDLWEWPSIELFQNAPLLIFNRFGQKVYETPSYENDWDGMLDGKPLQEDAYYYIIKLSNTELKGAVRIIR